MPVTPERKRELRARAKQREQDHAEALDGVWGRLGSPPAAKPVAKSAGLTPAEVAFVRQLHRLFEHVELDETYDGSGIAYLCVPLDLVAELFPEPPDEAA